MTDAQFLHTVGQRGLPLLIVYLERRRRIRLHRYRISVLLRPFVFAELLDGLTEQGRIVGEPPPTTGLSLQLRSIDPTPQPWWPPRQRAT